jgi:hypothetical protein
VGYILEKMAISSKAFFGVLAFIALIFAIFLAENPTPGKFSLHCAHVLMGSFAFAHIYVYI